MYNQDYIDVSQNIVKCSKQISDLLDDKINNNFIICDNKKNNCLYKCINSKKYDEKIISSVCDYDCSIKSDCSNISEYKEKIYQDINTLKEIIENINNKKELLKDIRLIDDIIKKYLDKSNKLDILKKYKLICEIDNNKKCLPNRLFLLFLLLELLIIKATDYNNNIYKYEDFKDKSIITDFVKINECYDKNINISKEKELFNVKN